MRDCGSCVSASKRSPLPWLCSQTSCPEEWTPWLIACWKERMVSSAGEMISTTPTCGLGAAAAAATVILLLAFSQYNKERKAGVPSLNFLGCMLVACQGWSLCRWKWYIYWTCLKALKLKATPKRFKCVFSQIHFQYREICSTALLFWLQNSQPLFSLWNHTPVELDNFLMGQDGKQPPKCKSSSQSLMK